MKTAHSVNRPPRHTWPIFTLFILLLVCVAHSFAATLTVTSTADSGAGSLRAEVAAANPGDTVTFATNLSGQTILLTSGQITLNNNATIDGSALASPVQLNGNRANRIFLVTNAAVTLDALILTNGYDNGSYGGGAVLNFGNLTVNNCTFASNSCGYAGGAINVYAGSLMANNSTFYHNSCGYSGGAIINYAPMTVNQCTIVSNTAEFAGGVMVWSGNPAANAVINQCTIVGNIGTNNAPGIYAFEGSANVTNSIVALNTDASHTPNIDLVGNPGSGFNIDQGGVNYTNSDVQLAPLGNYGGPTPTMPPLPGSPVIDGCTNGAPAFSADQRGFPRIVGAYADIGAVEVETSLVVTTTADSGSGSLRNAVAGIASGGTITFDPSLSGQTILVTNGPITLANSVTIDGSALASPIQLNGNHTNGIFIVNSGVTVTNNSLIITNGYDTSGESGGIYDLGTLTLNNCIIAGNSESGSGEGGGGVYDVGGSLTVSHCRITGNVASGGDGVGGGILIFGGTATLIQSTISSNSAGNYGGGGITAGGTGVSLTISNCTISGNLASHGFGGGIYVASFSGPITAADYTTVAVANSTITGNSGFGGGGFYFTYGTANIINSTVSSNSSHNSGGGISGSIGDEGPLTLINTIVAGNTASSFDDINGPFTGSNDFTNGNPMLAPLGNYGGPTETMPPLAGSPVIDAGDDSVTNILTTDQRGYPRLSGAHVDIGAVEFEANLVVTTTADSGSSSLRNAVTEIGSGGTITFSNNLSGQTILVTNGPIVLSQNVTIDGSALASPIQLNGNQTNRIFTVSTGVTATLDDLVITNGFADGDGGGIINSGNLTVNACGIMGNTVSNASATVSGGGVANEEGGTITLNNSTISGNVCAGANGWYGGGLYVGQSTATVNQCTISGNSTFLGGGGIWMFGTLTVIQSTLTSNTVINTIADTADWESGGGICAYTGTLAITNTIVAGNSAFTVPDLKVSQSATGVFGGGIFTNGNSLLAPLGDYGGPTQTMPPLAGSPVIDTGDDSITNILTTDQRGYPRLSGAHVDIGAVEFQYPVLTITSPSSGQVLTNLTITATGTASSAEGVSGVFVMDDQGAFVPAATTDGWTNWTASIILSPLANTLSAYAVSSNGVPSLTNSVNFSFSLTNFTTVTNHNKSDDVLTILINDTGPARSPNRVTPLKDGAIVAVSNKVTLTAVPGHNWIFSNWLFGTSQPYSETNSLTLKFVMGSNFIAEANFVTNVFLPMQGTYYGLFAPTNGPRAQTNSGAITFTVTPTGGLSGKLVLGATTATLAGSFNAGGSATVPGKVHGKSELTASLQLDFSNQLATGTISNAGFQSPLLANLNPFNAKNKTANFAGQYTLIIPGTNNPAAGPLGAGYATVKISPTGAVTLAGALADNTPVTASSAISKNGLWPLYLPLYKGNGSFWSWNYFDTNGVVSSNDVPITNATPSWINGGNTAHNALYATGFTNTNAVLYGSVYSSADHPVLSDLVGDAVIIEGGNLTNVLTNTLADSGAVDASNIVLTLAKGTGALSGNFLDDGRKIKLNGVILQGQSNVAGFFLGASQSGLFQLHP